jgi:hypothetical protein
MPIMRSSTTAVAASGLPSERGGSSAVGRGRAGLIIAHPGITRSLTSLAVKPFVPPRKGHRRSKSKQEKWLNGRDGGHVVCLIIAHQIAQCLSDS